MHIRRLELQGFKSFVDRQTFHFGSGIAGVVGPNGCGKSNVVDALKWVIGEQSPKSLRGANMQDVIFNGSAKRKRVGMAEVVVTFAAGDEPFPGDFARFPEVQIGRRLYRDGGSEYLLNQEKVRRRDVVDLLMDTGVANKMYSFIEQGQIGRIVAARPEQRRTLIEEAAGISRFKAKKEEAESKLDDSLSNLDRATDVAEEMGRRLRSLEKQVEKAVRFRRAQAEQRQGELYLGLVKFNAFIGDRKQLNHDLLLAKRDGETATRDLARRNREIEERRKEIGVMAAAVSKLRDELSELEAQRRETESARHYQGRESETLATRLEVLVRDAADASRRRAEAHAEATRLEGELQASTASAADRAEVLRRHDERCTSLVQELVAFRPRVEGLKREHMNLVTGLVQKRTRLQVNQQRQVEQKERIRSFAQDRAEVDVDLAGLQGQLALTKVGLEQAESGRAEVLAELDAARRAEGEERSTVGRAKAEKAAAEKRITQAERELARLEAQVQSLEDLDRSHAGVDGGARKALDAVEGASVLAEHLRVPADLEPAVRGALGEALEHVIVHSREDLLCAAEAAAKAGRTGLLMPGVGADGLAAELAGTETGHGALGRLLGQCERAANLLEALPIHERTGHAVACDDGAFVRGDGVVFVGDARRGAGLAILERRRRLEALQGQLTTARERVDELQGVATNAEAAVEAAEARAESASTRVEALRRRVEEARGKVGEVQLELKDKARELRHREERVRYLATEQGRLEGRLKALTDDAEQLKKDIVRGESRQEEVEEQLKHLQAELVRRETEASEAREALSAARTAGQAARERVDLLRQTLTTASTRRTEAQSQLERATSERSTADARLKHLRGDDARLAKQLEVLSNDQTARREVLNVEKERLSVFRRNLGFAEEALRGARDKATQSKERLNRLEMKLQEVRLSLTALREKVEGRYAISLPAMLDRLERDAALLIDAGEQAPIPVPGLEIDEVDPMRVVPSMLEDASRVQAWVKRLTDIRGKLDRMGEVNLAALTEYTEVSERYTWLETQRADLEDSVNTIRRTIARINKTCRERFRSAFDRVDRNFRSIYPRLVGGGQARLKLTDEEDLLTSGVDIFVQPPGKRLQNLTLLSGGEKAMCAIALLFALFKVKPSPFCLLDEVDAPLDESNGARFNNVLREMSALTQFIVITHNKKTMEVVDTLYGVTMPDPGISRLVSVKVS
jgi:chromosome segregation protein